MKRNNSVRFFLPLAPLAFLLLVLVSSSFAQSAEIPAVQGAYRGFFISIGNPEMRGELSFMIDSMDARGAFMGSLMMEGMTFIINGKIDPATDVFKYSATGPTGVVKGIGKWQSLNMPPGPTSSALADRGGALVFAGYKFEMVTGATDMGNFAGLMNFSLPPDPIMPMDVHGTWHGMTHDLLNSAMGMIELMIEQDQMRTGPGTGLNGEIIFNMGMPDEEMIPFVGTVDAEGNVVGAGLAAKGIIVIGGMVAAGDLNGSMVNSFTDRGLDLISFQAAMAR